MINFTEFCETSILHLTHHHRALLTVLDVLVLLGNAVANTLVIYIPTKTKAITNFSCRLMCLLTVNDLAIASVAQKLFIVKTYRASCITNLIYQLVSRFLPRLSGYIIGVTGIDRYVRIRYKMKFKMILTTRFLIILMVLILCVASIQAMLITLGLLLHKETIFSSTAVGMDFFLFIFVVCLQIRTIATTNSTTKEAKNPKILQHFNKKITKLCSRTMISCTAFYIPYMTVDGVRNKIREVVSLKTKVILDFLFMISIIFAFLNSFVSALLFLSSNVKAKPFLKQTYIKYAYISTDDLEDIKKESRITVT